MVMLFLRWESGDNGFRRYCAPLKNADIFYTYDVFYNNAGGASSFCMKDIGVEKRIYQQIDRYVFAPSNRADIQGVRGVITLDDRYYPKPITNSNGGLKYEPLEVSLPDTIDMSPYGEGLGIDIEFDVKSYNGTGAPGYGPYKTVTITGVTLMPPILYKTDEVIGDGSAYGRSVYGFNSSGNRVRFVGYDWRTYYGASYRTIWDIDLTTEKPGIGAVSLYANIPDGSYTASTLPPELGYVDRNRYLSSVSSTIINRANYNNVPDPLIYGNGPLSTSLARQICIF